MENVRLIWYSIFQVSWYWYLLLGFVDVQGNYLCKSSIPVFIFECNLMAVDNETDKHSLLLSQLLQKCCVNSLEYFVAVNKAYQYSSITSVALLDCWTIAWVIGLTWTFLGTRYSLWQILGAAISAAGLGLVLLSDAGVGGGGEFFSVTYYSQPLPDILC